MPNENTKENRKSECFERTTASLLQHIQTNKIKEKTKKPKNKSGKYNKTNETNAKKLNVIQ